MNRLKLLPVLALAVSAHVGFAQTFEEKVCDITLLMDRQIQNEIGVSEALRTKLNKHADEFNEKAQKMQADYQKSAEGKNPPPPPPLAKLAELEAGFRKKILAELNTQQKKRLSEITLQVAGFTALLNEAVAEKIGLNKAQIDKLRKAFEANAKEAQRLQQGAMKKIHDKYENEKPANEEEARKLQEKIAPEIEKAQKELEPKLLKLRGEFLTTVKKTVKAIQLNRFEALQGKPYKGLQNN